MFRVGVLCRATKRPFFILISIGCSGALLLSLIFEMEIKYVMMMRINHIRFTLCEFLIAKNTVFPSLLTKPTSAQ